MGFGFNIIFFPHNLLDMAYFKLHSHSSPPHIGLSSTGEVNIHLPAYFAYSQMILMLDTSRLPQEAYIQS
jgi:hypothetical protein